MALRVVNWNVEWATPHSRRTAEILGRIARHTPEIVCLTEAHDRLLSDDGHIICSQPDYGYTVKEGRYKVMLWSKEPWKQVDDRGIGSMPPGRFVSGVTRTPLGYVTVMGICIPWSGSRTEANRQAERRRRWADHEQYLVGLAEVLERADVNRLVVIGDFNQTIGQRSSAPPALQLAIRKAFPSNMRIATSELTFQGRRTIDHIALSADWAIDSLEVISNLYGGRKLSDHFGVVADLSTQYS